MRAIGTLVLVFGAVAVVFLIHWLRRAASAGVEAASILKETGSLTETARRLYAHESLPDFVRISSRQKAYVEHNREEFFALFGDAVERLTSTALEQLRRHRAAGGTAPFTGNDEDHVREMAILFCAKEWCESRGVR